MRVRACLYSRAQMNARVSRSGDADVALSRSLRVWFVCVAFLIAVNLYITLVGGGLQNDPRSGLFSWPSLAIFAIAGVAGIWLSRRTGFPAAWDPQIDNLRRFVYPAAWGLVLGLALVAHDLVFHWTATYKTVAGLPSFNALGPFPGPLLFYAGGAILVEVFYRLVPIPLLMWLVSFALRGGARESIFWLFAVLTSLIEPLTQDLVVLQRPGLEAAASVVFAIDFALN